MNDREFITSIRDQCNAQLGSAPPVDPPPPSTPADIILGMPGEQSPVTRTIAAGQGVTVRMDAPPGANLRVQGSPGAWFNSAEYTVNDGPVEKLPSVFGGVFNVPVGVAASPATVKFRVYNGASSGNVAVQSIYG